MFDERTQFKKQKSVSVLIAVKSGEIDKAQSN